MKLDAALLLKLPSEMKTELEVLGVKLDRPVAWLIRHAITKLLEEEKQNGG